MECPAWQMTSPYGVASLLQQTASRIVHQQQSPKPAIFSLSNAQATAQPILPSSPGITASAAVPVDSSFACDMDVQCGNWFAEGWAAERQLISCTITSPLPKIYARAIEDEDRASRRFSPST
jgi:hypothetical protein